jgi:hypothetical protein
MTFRLISDFPTITRKSFELAVPGILDPLNANPLLYGEFLEINSSYQAVRGTGNNASPAFAAFAERGRTDTQAIGRVPLLQNGGYEAETQIMDSTSLVVNAPLMVGSVTIGGVAGKRGLVLQTSTNFIIGYVTRPVNAQGWLRFIRFS